MMLCRTDLNSTTYELGSRPFVASRQYPQDAGGSSSVKLDRRQIK
jgi:hypothetical protein